MIHRGFDIPEKADYRNYPMHNHAARVKKRTGCKLYFDPSHAYGPRMRDSILDATIDAANMKLNESGFLYDGILIEVGTSKTDTGQHISISELKKLVVDISKNRDL
ncbi:MAG: hypothetical protein Q9M91_00600 [Candidatus Dojkabacteria bacterium]|nr:hypothetical protein [Candidatus Dojkabacteria bacterium]MDQ7020329.1 hypothetical protein [Candidatus Dojkabacteria bacterium]